MFDRQKQQKNSRLGNILLKRRLVTQQQLEQALIYQQQHQVRLGEALMDMKLIDQQQLRSALRKQSWLRIATTCVTLTLAPFSPAFAASQGKLGSSSSASSQISLTILPDTVNHKSSNVNFDNQELTQTSRGFCTSDFNTDLYRISASGSGEQGEFTLTDTQNNQINYDVAFQYQGQSPESLSNQKSQRSFRNTNRGSRASGCFDAANNNLKISLTDQNRANQSNYTGALTITIAAE